MSIDLSWWQNIPQILDEPNDILREYILNPQIPIHDPDLDFIPQKYDESRLYYAEPCSASTTIVPERCPQTGKILDFIEVSIEDAGSTARNSLSLRRAPGPPDEAVRGSAMNYPFWPGGFDEPESLNVIANELNIDKNIFEENLLNLAPGFTEGLNFDQKLENVKDELSPESTDMPTMVDLLSIIEQENDILGLWMKEESKLSEKKDEVKAIKTNVEIEDSILQVPETKSMVLDISNTKNNELSQTQWAEVIDTQQAVKDFNVRIPEPAHKYPFELDNFQKQAILKLEEHSHVFVAAHTSAGKTVVAEYAIALSQKHMTSTIYTSPIKALSNQKYRDFKHTFGDVGLITGDIQIDPTSSCLIMTTEILRSMLYCGSEVTRDLEYVIFDEVHYITDADRGHVWEEVLILLPDHVTILMLSATVPNTLEFASWVGQTKRKKVYVISTLKRPVPLKHYLYVPFGGKGKDDVFLIVDENGKFQMKGYSEAVAAKESRTKKMGRHLNKNQEKTLWESVIAYLRRTDKLPVVAFTLSRNRCDKNAESMRSCDLCTNQEKSIINRFFLQCMQSLKPPDRELPQVKNMRFYLERGYGVHHSGILPILKEIVEILFQCGLVKLLFATETFAMGVNMPARTVVFDSDRKFDGHAVRMLEPAEYTQMAGRAGRRGHDANGIVILLCKNDEIPDKQLLETMMLGKPSQLKSQFKLTYAMILKLLRVEMVTMEDIMSHSFREFYSQMKIPESKLELKTTEEKISMFPTLGEHLKPLCDFYDISVEYWELWDFVMPTLISQPKIRKELCPGRVLIITHKHHYNKLAIILTTGTSNNEITFKVLVLDNQHPNVNELQNDRGDLWNRMVSLTPKYQKFIPEGIGGHSVLVIKPHEIMEITTTNIKVDANVILQNWDQRQIPRFKDSPPGPSVVKVVTELNKLNDDVRCGTVKLQFLNLSQMQLNVTNDNIIKSLEILKATKEKLDKSRGFTKMGNFDQQFGGVYDRKKLEQRLTHLKYQISNKSMSLYPEYCNKLKVLQHLKYINEHQEVAMKGTVACEMGSNELMVTEIVFHNTITNLEPAEIAALLSSLVFQAKTDNTPNLTNSLKEGVKAIEAIEKYITKVETEYKIYSEDDIQARDKLNFGLVEVVYEWARNKPFAEIKELTDVQEGIIVRCIQQLHEILRDVKTAARIIGDPVLHSKMEEASNVIKRDIVFAASLYTQNETVVVNPLAKK